MVTIMTVAITCNCNNASPTAFFDGLTALTPKYWWRLHEADIGAASEAQDAVNIGSAGLDGFYKWSVNPPTMQDPGPLNCSQTSFGVDFSTPLTPNEQSIRFAIGQVFSITAAGTFGFFYKRTNNLDQGRILTQVNASVLCENGAIVQPVAGSNGRMISRNTSLGPVINPGDLQSGTGLTSGFNWHFYVITADGLSRRKMYFDGVETTLFDPTPPPDTDSAWFNSCTSNLSEAIAAKAVGPFAETNYLSGKLSEVFMFDSTVLTSQQILDLWNAANDGQPVP